MCDEASEAPNLTIGSQAMISIHILAEQCDLAHTTLDQGACLGFDLSRGAREFSASCIGDDTESAEFIAALLDGEEGRDAAFRHGLRQMLEFVFRRKFGFNDRPAAQSMGLQEVGQAMIALRPEDEIDGP